MKSSPKKKIDSKRPHITRDMRSLILCFLYKSFTAARTGNVNLALTFGNAKIILAGGTFEEAKSPALAQLVYLSAEIISDLVPQTHEGHVFRSAPLYIAGKNTEYSKNDHGRRN